MAPFQKLRSFLNALSSVHVGIRAKFKGHADGRQNFWVKHENTLWHGLLVDTLSDNKTPLHRPMACAQNGGLCTHMEVPIPFPIGRALPTLHSACPMIPPVSKRPFLLQDGAAQPSSGRRGAVTTWAQRTEVCLDNLINKALPAGQHLPSFVVAGGMLAGSRRQVVASLVQRYRPQVDALAAAVMAGDAAASAAYDALLAATVTELRQAPLPGWQAALGRMDELWYRDTAELSDSPTLPMPARLQVLQTLHAFNEHSGMYRRWAQLMAPTLAAAEAIAGRTHPVHLLDLAAGTGGFSLSLKALLGERVAVTATDLMPEFLASGAQTAAARGLDVRFARQDATCLHNLRSTGVDIITCTQSLHHFSPGMVGRMLAEAARVARVGVYFIDGERDLVTYAVLVPLMAVYGRSWPVVHDTAASIRRMYVAEELELIGRLAPLPAEVAAVRVGRMPPGHAYLRLDKLKPATA